MYLIDDTYIQDEDKLDDKRYLSTYTEKERPIRTIYKLLIGYDLFFPFIGPLATILLFLRIFECMAKSAVICTHNN